MEPNHTSEGIRTNIDASKSPVPGKWIRLPKQGKICEHSGLGRAYLFKLLKSDKVQSKSLRAENASRGVRIIWLPSLMKFIENHQEGDGR